MGVGFAVARFGLFLREMGSNASHINPHTMGLSVISGVLLVAIGVVVVINAAVRHILIVRELRTGQWVPGRISKSAVGLALVLALLGIGMALYLLITR